MRKKDIEEKYISLIALADIQLEKIPDRFLDAEIRTQARSKLSPDRTICMIRKLKSGEYRLYSRKTDPKTGKRKNLGTFKSRTAAEKHEREVQYFKRHG